MAEIDIPDVAYTAADRAAFGELDHLRIARSDIEAAATAAVDAAAPHILIAEITRLIDCFPVRPDGQIDASVLVKRIKELTGMTHHG